MQSMFVGPLFIINAELDEYERLPVPTIYTACGLPALPVCMMRCQGEPLWVWPRHVNESSSTSSGGLGWDVPAALVEVRGVAMWLRADDRMSMAVLHCHPPACVWHCILRRTP